MNKNLENNSNNSTEFKFSKNNNFKGFKTIKSNDKKFKFSLLKLITLVLIFILFGYQITFNPALEVFKTPFGKIGAIFKTNSNNTSNKVSETKNLDNLDFSNISKVSESVAEKVLPSIVGIELEYNLQSLFNKQVAAKGSGSGIILSKDGYILTNSHVVTPSKETNSRFYTINGNTKITVTLSNDEKVPAKVIGVDEISDLAVIKVEKDNLTPAKLGNSDEIKLGQFVMAIGSPLGLNGTVTSGIISTKSRKVSLSDGSSLNAIQTDASINQGNSGGALVNAKGEVIGVNTLKLAGNGVEGIGFAIPINQTKKISEELIKNGSVRRPALGIVGKEITEETAQVLGVKKGIFLLDVAKDGSADKAGIKKSDVITKFNGKEVSSISDLNEEKNNISENQEVDVEIIRAGEKQTIKVKMLIFENKSQDNNLNNQNIENKEENSKSNEKTVENNKNNTPSNNNENNNNSLKNNPLFNIFKR